MENIKSFSAGRFPLLLITSALFILSGCSAPGERLDPSENLTNRESYYSSNAYSAAGQNERVRYLVLHYTALNEADSLRTLTQDVVSAHYLVPGQPKVYQGKPVVLQLVPEEKRAWHAGISDWQERSNLNDSSIGIEIVNLGYKESMFNKKIWYPYSDKQIAAVAVLASDIIRRYQLSPDAVVGHSDIAPLRKSDPGRLFPWKKLAAMGIGAWPDNVDVIKYLAGRSRFDNGNIAETQKYLKLYGYSKIPQSGVLDEETQKTLSAFQMHFRPYDIDGRADAETEAIAKALVEKYRSI